MTKDWTYGQALVALLEEYGVDTVFGIPGVHTLELYRGLVGRNIRHVLTRHEQGAGFMADGYARVSGKPGVCFVITGPGVTNIATPMGQAYADSIPMLVISSVNETDTLGRGIGRLHETKDQQSLTRAITALSATAYKGEDIPGLIAQAFDIFNSQRPRPVHIAIPMDVLACPVQAWPTHHQEVTESPVIDPESLLAASRLLNRAKLPMIIAGGGAIESHNQIKALAECLSAPVFTTVAGKGILPPQHNLFAGAILCTQTGWDMIQKADVVLAIGTELADTDMWRDTLPIEGDIIRLDIDANKFEDLYPCHTALHGDASVVLDALLPLIQFRHSISDVPINVKGLPAAVAKEQKGPWLIVMQLLMVIRQSLPSNTVMATDMTQIAYAGNYLFNVAKTRQWLHPTGYGTLGYALPAGIGAAIADPQQPVAILCGDGGFQYTMQELATAVEEVNGPLIVLLWNNNALGQIRDDMAERDIPLIGVLPHNPDFQTLAASFGCKTYQPNSIKALQENIKDAVGFRGVSFIEMAQHKVFSTEIN